MKLQLIVQQFNLNQYYLAMVSTENPVNYLMEDKKPPKNNDHDQFYQFEKLMKLDYGKVWGPETHKRRRQLILKKHPDVKSLLGPDKPYTILLCLILVPLSIFTCYLVKDASWTVYLLTMYLVGATIAHTLHVCIHDLTHFSAHSNKNVCRIVAILCNLSMGIPSAISFGKHHADHHNYLGQKNKDPDLPVEAQAKWIKNHPLGKILFWFFLTIVYGARPMLFYDTKLTKWEMINFSFIFLADMVIYKYWGMNGLGYFLLCAFFSIGPHPTAIHVLAEHYEFIEGLETYDYFGPFNFWNLNMGYHIEHHDFPTCPWYNLPKLRKAAPEFYDQIPYHTSYFKLVFKFLFDYNYNLYNRTIRIDEQKNK